MAGSERKRRVRNLEPCHEIARWNAWFRVVAVEPDEYDRNLRVIHLVGRAPVRKRPNDLILSRIAPVPADTPTP